MAVRTFNRTELLKNRARVAFGCVLFGYATLAARLAYLQGVQGASTRATAISRRTGYIPKPARRGTIYDRNGKQFAVSLFTANLGFDPSMFAKPERDPKKIAEREKGLNASISLLAEILHQPPAEIAGKVQQARTEYAGWKSEARHSTREMVLKSERFGLIQENLDADTVRLVNDNHYKLKGFGLQDDTRRAYLQGDSALQVVGYVNNYNKPVTGLELTLNRSLERHSGYVKAERDARGREIPGTKTAEKLPSDGLDVHLTLDSSIQQIAREELETAYAKYHPKGAEVVVVDPATGDVLAMVSLPTFDPNPGAKRPEDLQEKIGLYQIDRCACRVYEPGSTLKTLAIAYALDKGIIRTDSYFHCSGSLLVNNHVIHDSHGEAHGDLKPEDILRHSCNVCTAQIGMKMGAETLYDAERQFGLGSVLDTHLPKEQRGSMAKKHLDYTQGQAARVAFGQAITTTPLHLAMAYAAIANNGVLMKPRLIASLRRGDQVVQSWQPAKVRQAITPQTSEEMMKMLRTVVVNGTGRSASVRGYLVAGKTGTSYKYKAGAYVGSFIGVVPATPNPKFRAVILVAIDEPQGAYYGAEVAAPVFQQIAARVMNLKTVPEDDPEWAQYKTAHTVVAADSTGHQKHN